MLLQGPKNPRGFAAVVLAVQVVAALVAFALALRPERHRDAPPPQGAIDEESADLVAVSVEAETS